MEKKTYTLKERAIDIYLQKSLKFLYPLLRIVTPTKNMPINTYLTWIGEVGIDDCKLVCVYELREDAEFKTLEAKQLQGNALFEDYKESEDGKGVYIFRLDRYSADVYQFLKGRYSLMSKETKDIILNFYKANIYSHEYMDSYLNPNKLVPSKGPVDPEKAADPVELESYFMVYARLLLTDKNAAAETDEGKLKDYSKYLAEVGELCDPWNPEKENYTANVLEPKIFQ